jgi:hypothetical protein
LKLKIDTLTFSKNSQILYADTEGNYEQFSQLCQHPNLHRIRVKNPRTDSPFESLMNLKRGLILLEKSDKFSKNPSWLELHKHKFSWYHLHVRKGVTIQVPKSVVWEK